MSNQRKMTLTSLKKKEPRAEKRRRTHGRGGPTSLGKKKKEETPYDGKKCLGEWKKGGGKKNRTPEREE